MIAPASRFEVDTGLESGPSWLHQVGPAVIVACCFLSLGWVDSRLPDGMQVSGIGNPGMPGRLPASVLNSQVDVDGLSFVPLGC